MNLLEPETWITLRIPWPYLKKKNRIQKKKVKIGCYEDAVFATTAFCNNNKKYIIFINNISNNNIFK